MTEQQLSAAGIRRADSLALYPQLHKANDAGLPLLVVENALGKSVIALQGAHVLSFQPVGGKEMLWLSPLSQLVPETPIRGGIPLCLPWFGPGPDGKAMHGFARVKPWTLTAAERLPSGATRLVLELSGDATTSALWPHAFRFVLAIEVGSSLKLDLRVDNAGADAAPLAFAFHTYFAVPDVAAARVDGLEDRTYIDKVDNFARKTQEGAVRIGAVTDRIYLDVAQRQTLTSADGSVTIDSAAACAVVWNAWNNDANIPDIGAGNHVAYLCVERGDVADRAVTLPPGGSYRATMTLA